jgi:hypothetical protein
MHDGRHAEQAQVVSVQAVQGGSQLEESGGNGRHAALVRDIAKVAGGPALECVQLQAEGFVSTIQTHNVFLFNEFIVGFLYFEHYLSVVQI